MIEALIAVGAAAVLLLVFRLASRRVERHRRGKVASVTAAADGEFSLRHAPASAGTYLAYLHYAIEYRGTEDDYGLRCQVEGRVGGLPVFARDLGIVGAISNPAERLAYREEVSLQHDVDVVTGGIGNRRRATVLLGAFEGCAAGAEILVSGAVTTCRLTRLGALEVYLVPAALRL